MKSEMTKWLMLLVMVGVLSGCSMLDRANVALYNLTHDDNIEIEDRPTLFTHNIAIDRIQTRVPLSFTNPLHSVDVIFTYSDGQVIWFEIASNSWASCVLEKDGKKSIIDLDGKDTE